LKITTQLLQLPAARRYRVAGPTVFDLGPYRVEHRLDASQGVVLVEGWPIRAARRASRWGPATGAWVLFCVHCGKAVGALWLGSGGWRCRTCYRIASTPLERLDTRSARATQPRRLGEPRWRWVKRTAGGAALQSEILAEVAVLLDRQITRLEAEDDAQAATPS
jgi:hypothetical protein